MSMLCFGALCSQIADLDTKKKNHHAIHLYTMAHQSNAPLACYLICSTNMSCTQNIRLYLLVPMDRTLHDLSDNNFVGK